MLLEDTFNTQLLEFLDGSRDPIQVMVGPTEGVVTWADLTAPLNLVSGNGVGLTFRSSADGTPSYDAVMDAVDGAFKVSKRPPYAVLASHPMTVQRNQRYEVKVVANGNTGDPMGSQLLPFQSRGGKMMTVQNGLGSGCTTATPRAHRPSDR